MDRSPEETWQNITLRIEVARTLWVIAVECASPEVERAFFLRLLARCRQKGRRAVLEPDPARSLDMLAEELSAARASPDREDANPKAVRAVRLPEPASATGGTEPQGLTEQRALRRLNEEMSAYSEGLRGVVFLVGGRDFLRRFPNLAPVVWVSLKEKYQLAELAPPSAEELAGLDATVVAQVDACTFGRMSALPPEPLSHDLRPLTELVPSGPQGVAELSRLLHAALRAHVAKAGLHYQTNPPVVGAHGLAPQGSISGVDCAVPFRFVDGTGAPLPGATQASKLGFPHPVQWVLIAPAGLAPSASTSFGEPGSDSAQVWGKARVEALLSDCPPLYARYYPAEARRVVPRSFDGGRYDGLPYAEMDAAYRRSLAVAASSIQAPALPPTAPYPQKGAASVPLAEVFIPPRFARDDEREGPVSMGRVLEHRRSVFDTDPARLKRSTHHGERKMVGLEALLREKRSIVVLGDPGAGKTTLLRFLALVHAGAASLPGFEPEARVVPMYVSLREFADAEEQYPGISIVDFLEMQARRDHGISRAHRVFFEAALRMGDAFVLLDGLDEVRQEDARRRISRQVRAFQVEYQQSRLWVTSRVQGYTVDFELPRDRFLHVRLGSLEAAQVGGYVQRWIAVREPDPSAQAALVPPLQEAIVRRPPFARLAVSPLLLTLLVELHLGWRELPRHRAELYDRCVEALLLSHPGGRDLDLAAQKDCLSHLALSVQMRDSAGRGDDERGIVDRRDAIEALAERFAQRTGVGLQHAMSEMQAFIAALTAGHGLLVDKGADQLSFAHAAFQEYLAAWVYRCEGAAPPGFFLERIGKRDWEEVLLLRLYLVRSERDGEAGFRAIAGPLVRHLEGKSAPLGWMTLVRALRDDLDFDPADRRVILERALSYWIEDPRVPGTWSDAFEEVCRFSEKANGDLRAVVAAEIGRRGASEAVACLHLAARLFGVTEELARRLGAHRDLSAMLPDLTVFSDAPALAPLLGERASVSDWTAALRELASPRVYRLIVGWMTSPPAGSSTAPLEAATRVLGARITEDLTARAAFAAVQRVKDTASLLTAGGSVKARGYKHSVALPLGGARAVEEPVPPITAGAGRGLLRPAFARERVDAASTRAVERALGRWVEGFLSANAMRLPSPARIDPALVASLVKTLDSAVFDFGSVLVRDLVRDMARDYSGDLVRQVVRAFGRDFVRAFGRDFVRAFGRDFIRAFDPSLAHDFIREAVHTLVREHGPDAVRDFVHDYGVPADAADFGALWDRAIEDPATVDRALGDQRFWNNVIHFLTPHFSADPATPRTAVHLEFEDASGIPMLLFDLWNLANGMHALTIAQRLVLRFPAGDPSRAAVEGALNEHPFDVFPVALAWEEHARSLEEAGVSLSGHRGALAITHAAYAALTTGIALDSPAHPTWQRLLAGRDAADPIIEIAYRFHELCHFRDAAAHAAALRAELAKGSFPAEAPPPLAVSKPDWIAGPNDATAPSLAALLKTRPPGQR